MTKSTMAFLALGVQANNSSNYPAALPEVWPVVERLRANTLLMPVAWEQVEPDEDFLVAFKVDEANFMVVGRLDGQPCERLCPVDG